MIWELSHRCDPIARDIADRHYNRQSIGAKNFAPPGRCLVLRCVNEMGRAFWITSWPYAEYVRHAWAGAWVCSAFRNEGAGLSSEMIRDALAATRWKYPDIPDLGMVTFVNENKVRPKRDPGYCFIKAGFKQIGRTKGGLLALGISPEDIPDPVAPIGAQFAMAI